MNYVQVGPRPYRYFEFNLHLTVKLIFILTSYTVVGCVAVRHFLHAKIAWVESCNLHYNDKCGVDCGHME